MEKSFLIFAPGLQLLDLEWTNALAYFASPSEAKKKKFYSMTMNKTAGTATLGKMTLSISTSSIMTLRIRAYM
jgi:hypothetical protein